MSILLGVLAVLGIAVFLACALAVAAGLVDWRQHDTSH